LNSFKRKQLARLFGQIFHEYKWSPALIASSPEEALIHRSQHVSIRYSEQLTEAGIEPSVDCKGLIDRDFDATRPNEKWVTDVTEFKVDRQKL
jgi:transposase InsO family protein